MHASTTSLRAYPLEGNLWLSWKLPRPKTVTSTATLFPPCTLRFFWNIFLCKILASRDCRPLHEPMLPGARRIVTLNSDGVIHALVTAPALL
jgi:hypothetical protein